MFRWHFFPERKDSDINHLGVLVRRKPGPVLPRLIAVLQTAAFLFRHRASEMA